MNLKNTKTHNKTSSKNEKTYKKEIIDTEAIDSATTIERSPHDRYNPFAQISRYLIDDNSISMECRLLIIFLLAKPNNWKVNITNLRNSFEGNAGRDKIYALLAEAEKAGYMKKETKFVKGCIRKNQWFVSENKSFSNNSNGTDYQEPITRTLNKNDRLRNKNNTKSSEPPEIPVEKPKLKKAKAATAPSSPIIILLSYEWFNEKYGLYEKIENGLSVEDYEKLKNKIGEDNLHEAARYIKSITDKPKNPYRFSNKNLYKKLLEYHKKGEIKLQDKLQKQKEKALREGIRKEKPVVEIDKTEQYEKQAREIANKFQYENQDLRKDIRILEKKIEIRSLTNLKQFEIIHLPEPKLQEKLEKWAKNLRQCKP